MLPGWPVHQKVVSEHKGGCVRPAAELQSSTVLETSNVPLGFQMTSVQEFYVLRGQIQIALVAFVRLQGKMQSLKVKANPVMSVKRRLFNHESETDKL